MADQNEDGEEDWAHNHHITNTLNDHTPQQPE